MSDSVTNDDNIKKTVGFKVSPSEYNVLQQYAHLFHERIVQDPETNQTRNVRYQYMMQAEAQAKQNQVQQNG
jgi:hypothetical protein